MCDRLFVVASALLITLSAHAEDQTLQSRIVSVGLFKNGLAVVKRTVDIPGPGTYTVTSVPEPVHGTFWIESDAEVVTRVTTRDVEAPPDAARAGADFQQELAGLDVVVRLREPALETIAGRVIEFKAENRRGWDRNYLSSSYNDYTNWGPAGAANPQPQRYLVLATKAGRTYIDVSTIAALEVAGAVPAIKRKQFVLMFTVRSGDAAKPKPATIAISYLTKGMAWAPSYRVNVANPATLTLQQQAVIKNELEDIEDAELVLISGYPSVEFGHVTSPLSIRNGLANFFQQLGQTGALRHASRGDVVSGQTVMSNWAPSSSDDGLLPAIPEGEGVDLHFHSIGRHTMAAGDSLMLNVASGQAAYQRVVEWIIPDLRDARGRPIEEYAREQNPEKYDDSAWDALRFRNPLPFAMTTAPAMVVAGDRFNGQRTSYWTNAGEQTTLRVTKALSIRTRSTEYEDGDIEREFVTLWGNKYRKTAVRGEVSVSNHRNEAVTMVIRRRFSGELLAADEEPQNRFLEEGVYSVNRRNELTWTLTLEPGQERTLNYRYKVLVPH